MWAMILWDAAVRFVGICLALSTGVLLWQVVLPWWTRRRYERAKARQIRREIAVALEAQAVRAAQRARAELLQQVEQRRGER